LMVGDENFTSFALCKASKNAKFRCRHFRGLGVLQGMFGEEGST
jgi:hypothetical protein